MCKFKRGSSAFSPTTWRPETSASLPLFFYSNSKIPWKSDTFSYLKSNLCVNRSRFIPCISASQYTWILDQDRIPCPTSRTLAPKLGHVGPHCCIPFCKLCPWWYLPAEAAQSPHPFPHLCCSHWHLFFYSDLLILNLATSEILNNWTKLSLSSCNEKVWNFTWTS